jgi:hypothetical protein
MLKPILGEGYFKKFGEQKPRAFDSYVQQYGRLVDGQDKIIMGAQYSGYIEFKAKGAPLRLRLPRHRRAVRCPRPTASSTRRRIPTPPSCSWTGSSRRSGRRRWPMLCCCIRRARTCRRRAGRHRAARAR